MRWWPINGEDFTEVKTNCLSSNRIIKILPGKSKMINFPESLIITSASHSNLSLEQRLRAIIAQASWYETLASIRQLNLPDWFIAGGAIRNTVWQSMYADNCSLSIKDLDLVFFDSKTGREQELAAKQRLQDRHPNWVFDVKNQSSFGVWRPWQFVFTDTTDGIAHFLHTATAAGVRLSDYDSLEICQPYGLADLFDGVIRLTPFRYGNEAAQAKKQEYLSKCPALKVCQ